MKTLGDLKIIGISIRTSNQNGRAAQDIGRLWQRFMEVNIPAKIPSLKGENIYAVYTDYTSNHEEEYTTIIGMEVETLQQIPEGLIGREFKSQKYSHHLAKGEMPDAVVRKWQEIWSNDNTLNRAYTADFEVYGPNSKKGVNSEVEIYLSVN
ncbi:GyrI-like domain-containing protein [Jiulongibacter sp. NS-SX5]|uniref:GyrI-like domain-containing protein n=1 Tax=Jiulongibacter sp. NS-SX5 TaxID=3463854 RepID=UPI004058F260